MPDISRIGTSALTAYRTALATVSNNIANSSVEGYSRQSVELVTREAQFVGVGFIGTGVQSSAISRSFDQFTFDQYRENTSSFNQFDTFATLAGQVDNLLADPQTGLSPAIQNFFNAAQAVADDPTSTPVRQVFLSEGNALVQRFNSLENTVRSYASGADSELTESVGIINRLATGLADINDLIEDASQNGTGASPNDLLDERDRLLLDLSELIDVQTVPQQNNTVSVFIGTGQPLVVGDTPTPLTVANNASAGGSQDIFITQGNTLVNITTFLSGGKVGALLDFRDRITEPALSSLGRIATGIATLVNEQHNRGLDLDGNPGGNVFNVAPPNVVSDPSNTGTAAVTATISDVAELTTSDYTVDYDGTNYTITRTTDNVVAFTSAGPAPVNTTVDGIDFTISAGALAGDSFFIQPTRTSARDISFLLNDPSRIAAASPLRTDTTLSNLGDARLAIDSISDVSQFPLSANGGAIEFTYSAATSEFVITAGDAALLGTTFAYDPVTEGNGKQFTLGVPFDGVSITLSGTPSDGDTLTLADNVNGIGDNTNILAIAGLQDRVTLKGNNTFQSAFGQIVSDVGSRTRQANITRDSQQVLLEQSKASQDSISGVNLDEEAANLIRLQQAFQAAAQVISLSDEIFQTILQTLR